MSIYRQCAAGILAIGMGVSILGQTGENQRALHKKSLFWDFTVQPLCLCGVVLLGIHQPQRHRGHRGCTEKSGIETFCAKPNQSHVILDFGRCVPERKTISFALGSTTYELKKEHKKTCRLRYGTEIENPRWDGTLDNSCTVPRRIGKQKFVITGQGVDFSPLARYCKSTVN